MRREVWGGVFLALVMGALLSGCIDTLMNIKRSKEFVRGFNFPEPSDCREESDATVAEEDARRELFTALMPALVVGYERPVAVSQCLESLRTRKVPGRFATSLWQLGACRARQSVGEWRRFGNCLDESLGLGQYLSSAPGATPKRLDCTLTATDNALLLTSLGGAGDDLYAHRRAMSPDEDRATAVDGGTPPMFVVAEKVVEDVVAILGEDPTREAATPTRRGEYPSLALSGGAANGAFTAGFVFALLDLRERALAARWAEAVANGRDPTTDPSVAAILRDERFGALTGTSVGSLVAVLVDLYFADTAVDQVQYRKDLGDRQVSLLDCAHSQSALAVRRPAQACALETLKRDFTYYEESKFLCAQDVGAGDLLMHCASALMSFQPMEDALLKPFFREYEPLLTNNDVIREAAAVETRRAQLYALDERACGHPDDRSPAAIAQRVECLTNAVVASIDEPMLSTRKGWVTARPNEKWIGFWLDGGLQSGTPALRGLSLTRWPLPTTILDATDASTALRVLSVNTNRLESPTPAPVSGIFPMVFTSLGMMANQLRSWEQGLVVPYAAYRQQAACASGFQEVCPKMGPVAAAAPEVTSRRGMQWSVFMPQSLTPPDLSADAYQFDPRVMVGLFVLGEVTFHSGGAERLLEQLGWNEVRRWARGTELTRRGADASRRLALFGTFTDAARSSYTQRRKADFDTCFAICGSPSTAPVCSADLLTDAVSLLPGTAQLHLSDVRPQAFYQDAPGQP